MRPPARQLLAENAIQAMLVTKTANVRYLSRIAADGAVLLVQPKGFTLFADPLEIEAVRKAAPKGISVKPLSGIVTVMKNIRSCAFEEEDITVARLKRWKKLFPKTAFTATKDIVEHHRRTKDAAELKAILTANGITEDILARIPSVLKAGITEAGVAWIIECWAREAGAQKMGFDTIVAFGTNTSRPHHRPTAKKLKKGDLVQIDMGVVIDGYTSDRSAVYFTRKPTAKQKEVHKALQEAVHAGIAAIAPGVPCSEPDAAARKVLRTYKLEKYFIHSLGHGVGLEIHEGVSLSQRSKQRLLEHEVVTVEPGVYIEGKWGMRLEEMVVVQ
jgi:Xaa-Pro aminopeptidase